MTKRQIWIIDFGSQYTQLITRKSRELGYSSEIITVKEGLERFKKGKKPLALILSGGPASIFEDENNYAPFFEDESLPILGICYGMQLIGQFFKGLVEKGVVGEYGQGDIEVKAGQEFGDFGPKERVWMSHSDHISRVPEKFELVMSSNNGLVAGIKHEVRPLLAIQFHPEVEHTPNGKSLLSYFFEKMAKLEKDWSPSAMLEEAKDYIKKKKTGPILCAFSGGVDSLVAATLVALDHSEDLYCFFVDHGLNRPQDFIHLKNLQEKTALNIEILEMKDLFMEKLRGLSDPEEKRKVIGHTFIDVFEEKMKEYQSKHDIHFTHLLQGTLYPDVIESLSPHDKDGKSMTIKSHHNVGGLPERMKLELMEPLRYLFKDEVRLLGEQMGLPHAWVSRHPFPGPGIGIRVLGSLNEQRISVVQQSDQILFEELHRNELYLKTWQAFTVLLPVKTVGVKGDGRAYEEVLCLRLVDSTDGMTATWSPMPYEFLDLVSRRITNEVKGVTRVVYDITSKPPGTIEWE